MSQVLDYVGPTDLIRVAQASKRMREMVYEDARWVQRLKRMGCWNEEEARRNVAHVNGITTSLDATEHQQLKDVKPTANGARRRSSIRKDSVTDANELVSTISEAKKDVGLSLQDVSLAVLKHVKSIRGSARQEYGKVHSVLGPLYDDIIRTGGSTESLVFKRYSDPETQAQILAQLVAFSKSDNSDGWFDREGRLLSAISLFETAAIREFRNGYESEDIDGQMRRYARVVYALNGGQAAVDLFLHHNHLVTQKAQFGTVMDCIDLSTGGVKLEQTQAYLTRFGVAYNEESSIIKRAFPSPLDVMLPFLEKVGTDVLSPFLTALFDELHRENIESYLQAVSGTFVQCLRFMSELQLLQTTDEDLPTIVTRILGQIYEPHIDLYLAEELDFFRKGCDAAVQDWDRQLSEQAASTESFLMSNVNRQADKKDFLTSFKKVLMMPVNILPLPTFSSKTSEPTAEQEPKSGLSAPKHPRFSTVAPPTPFQLKEAPTDELAAKAAVMNHKLEGIRSLFSIEVALGLVHAAKLSLERAAQFVKLGGVWGNAARQQCEGIFVSLLQILGHRHVIEGFDKAVVHLSNYRPREQRERDTSGVEPLVTFLELVNVGDLILQMVDVFYEQELVGTKLIDRNDFLDPAAKGKKKFEQMLDERVASGLNKGINVLMEEVDYILATKQLTTDFNPGADSDSPQKTVDIGVSEAAVAVVDVVSSHTQMLVGSTDKTTLDVFNQEVGLRLFAAICKHLKRQRISVDGSLKLIR
jgi:recyclin-1